MAELIACRVCLQPNCEGCNINTLANMLFRGKFDCLMDEHHTISPAADVAPVVHGRWRTLPTNGIGGTAECSACKKLIYGYRACNCCPNCGAKMDAEA